jgi:hypothetical protein
MNDNQMNELAEAMKVVAGVFDPQLPTDEQAENEIDLVRKIINRHVDLGWLVTYGPEVKTGKFDYTHWHGHYEAKRELEMEVTA